MGFEELKQRQAAMWGSAPLERVAETLAECTPPSSTPSTRNPASVPMSAWDG
jgi:hypothetical protein